MFKKPGIQTKKGRGKAKGLTIGPSYSELREKILNTSDEQFEVLPTLKVLITCVMKLLEDQQKTQQIMEDREKGRKELEEKLRLQQQKNMKY